MYKVAPLVLGLVLGMGGLYVRQTYNDLQAKLDMLVKNEQQLASGLNLVYACKTDKPGAQVSPDCPMKPDASAKK